jgi:O-antigen/teichoic acid export membrane protein
MVLSRGLGPEGRGEVAAILLWGSTAFDIGGLGTPYAVAFYAAKRNPGSPDPGMAITRRAFPALAALSIALFAGFVVASGDTVGPDPLVLGAMVFWIVLFLAAEVMKRRAQGYGEMAIFNLAGLVSGAAPVLGIAALALFSALTVQSTIFVYTLCLLAAAVYLARWDSAGGSPRVVHIEREVRKDFWKYSLWSMVSVLAVKGNRSFDLLLLSLAGVAADIGYYAVAASSALTVSIVGESLGLHLFQRVARDPGVRTQVSLVAQYSMATFGLSVAAGIVFWLLAPTLIPLVYGEDFSPAVTPARILIVGGVLVSASQLLGEVLKALGSPRLVAAAELAGAVVTLAGLLVFGVDALSTVAVVAVAGYAATTLVEGLLTTRALVRRRRTHGGTGSH